MADPAQPTGFLSDPLLLWPTVDSVRVVWFSESPGDRHWVEVARSPLVGQPAAEIDPAELTRHYPAQSRELTRTREDGASQLPATVAARLNPTEAQGVWRRPIWRQEAIVTDLRPGDHLAYRVCSAYGPETIASRVFSLAPLPPLDQPLKILLTSDHQLKPLVAANLQAVVATIGCPDAVFLAGDLVNVPDRASEWFDDHCGGAFFPCLQGRAAVAVGDHTYQGGEILQHAPLFPAMGNHEVMGRAGQATSLNHEMDLAIPRWVAAGGPGDPSPSDAASAFADGHPNDSWNHCTYDQLFAPPGSEDGESPGYYAVSFGPVRLVVLLAAIAWRTRRTRPDRPGCYQEASDFLPDASAWGWGQHVLGDLSPGSPQFTWLEAELASPEFQQATYRLVMLHHPPHTLGDNGVPGYIDPVQTIIRDAQGHITAVGYDYPRDRDALIHHVVPLIQRAGGHLIHFGHSHLWNRFHQDGLHFLESSNVGNSYGAAWAGSADWSDDDRPNFRRRRPIPEPNNPNYPSMGDLHGLDPVMPSIAPLRDTAGQPLPFVASNHLAVFSILDTATGTVASYRFDVRQPERSAVKFDEFSLLRSTVEC